VTIVYGAAPSPLAGALPPSPFSQLLPREQEGVRAHHVPPGHAPPGRPWLLPPVAGGHRGGGSLLLHHRELRRHGRHLGHLHRRLPGPLAGLRRRPRHLRRTEEEGGRRRGGSGGGGHRNGGDEELVRGRSRHRAHARRPRVHERGGLAPPAPPHGVQELGCGWQVGRRGRVPGADQGRRVPRFRGGGLCRLRHVQVLGLGCAAAQLRLPLREAEQEGARERARRRQAGPVHRRQRGAEHVLRACEAARGRSPHGRGGRGTEAHGRRHRRWHDAPAVRLGAPRVRSRVEARRGVRGGGEGSGRSDRGRRTLGLPAQPRQARRVCALSCVGAFALLPPL
jgi:hypothetical protein